MTRRLVLSLLLLAGSALALRAQQEERLWMPEGYRLLSVEERKSLSLEELNAIGTKNTALVRQAIRALTPQERQAVAEGLQAFGRTHPLDATARQYVSLTTMMLLSATVEEKNRDEQAEERARFEKLLRDQEATTSGFPSDQKSVEDEASAVEAAFRKADLGKPRHQLYLRVLKPLRARPWNDAVRVAFRKIVRSDATARRASGLYDAALAFLHARQSADAAQGAWVSLEAFLRLSMRGEVAEAKKLFAIANAKNALDVECRIFPLLIAEIEGDAAEATRLMARAMETWPDRQTLEKEIFLNRDLLPKELLARADAFERRYKQEHPADWESRVGIVAASLEAGRSSEVEDETATLLSLPVSVLPEPHRSEFLALKLQAMAGLGKCEEAGGEIPRLEASAQAAYPREADPDSPPRPRSVKDVRELKASVAEGRGNVEKLQRSIEDGSLERSPEWREVPGEQRRRQAAELVVAMEKELAEMESVVQGRDEASAAAKWTRREMARWQQERGLGADVHGDLAGRAERLSIRVRSAEGNCLLKKQRAAEAARVVSPCIGTGLYLHDDCVFPLIEAVRALTVAGTVKDAAAAYTLLASAGVSSMYLYDLYLDIEKAAPGTVKKPEEIEQTAPAAKQ